MSVFKDRQVDLAESRRVSDHFNFDDLLARDLEDHYQDQPSTRSHDDTHGPVHERQLCEPGTSREGECLLSHSRCVADLVRFACRHSSTVNSNHNIRGEHRQKRLKVTVARCSHSCSSVGHIPSSCSVYIMDE
jgi:hypothetical protein